MWMLRRKPEELRDEERKTLACLFDHSPALNVAYTFMKDLTKIFEQDLSKRQAQHKIQVWKKQVKKSGLQCFTGFLKTLSKYLHGVTNYFVHWQTSGFVEGTNNKIKVIKRRCYGIFNVHGIRCRRPVGIGANLHPAMACKSRNLVPSRFGSLVRTQMAVSQVIPVTRFTRSRIRRR